MKKVVAAIHGILTGQTEPSWPDRFDAWMFQRDPEMKVLKKEYRAGPFPRWNCWAKDPALARGLANEIELFVANRTVFSQPPNIWFIAHSNGAVIALLCARYLIERGRKIEGLLLTGAACEADIARSGIQDWQARGMLRFAIAYSSLEDKVLDAVNGSTAQNMFSRMRHWVWGKLLWPYGTLGRSGWMRDGQPVADSLSGGGCIQTRWFAGGHGAYFSAENCGRTFEQVYRDITPGSAGVPPANPSERKQLAGETPKMSSFKEMPARRRRSQGSVPLQSYE